MSIKFWAQMSSCVTVTKKIDANVLWQRKNLKSTSKQKTNFNENYRIQNTTNK